MSFAIKSQSAVPLFSTEHHVTDWDMPIGQMDPHPGCSMGKPCIFGQDMSCPTTTLFSAYRESGLWDASDPNHRACYLGRPCSVTGEKLCVRILHLAKHHHTYGTCSGFSGPDHMYCPIISDLDRKWLFPRCAACGILTEARGLVLIHRRMLDECSVKEGFTDEDIRLIRNSLAGYMRAYEVRREMHVKELQNWGQAVYELEMKFAGGDGDIRMATGLTEGRNLWWRRITRRIAKAVVQFLSSYLK